MRQALVVSLFLLAASCTGADGPKGDPGDPGTSCTVTDNGDGTKTITCTDGTVVTIHDGDPAVDTGLIAGTVTSSIGGAASDVTVSTIPDVGATATTSATGTFSIEVPVGIYSVVFESPDYEGKQVDNVSIVGGGVANVAIQLLRVNPLVARATDIHQAGFGQNVTLSVEVTGAADGVSFHWAQTGGPSEIVLSSDTAREPTFTTPTLAEIADTAEAKLDLEPRLSMVGFNHQQVADTAYTFAVTVTDGPFTTTTTQKVELASVTAGGIQHAADPSGTIGIQLPTGILAIGNDAPAATYAWTLTVPEGATAALQAADTRNPWFIPDTGGQYVLTNTAASPAHSLTVRVSDWYGQSPDTPDCRSCHSDEGNGWQASGHATMAQRGIDGELSPYYNEECLSCHTVGNNPAADNGGFDDVAESMSWQFPDIGPGAYESMPTPLKELSNIQCESCHGPGFMMSTPSFSAQICATCHQEEPYHDLFKQWQSSGHANLEIAMDEATTETRGTTAAHCGRCHSGQGYARWSEQLKIGHSGNIEKPDGTAADLAYLNSLGLDKAEVQPQTCQTCHDPHTTQLRTDGSQDLALPSGYTVSGLGKGTLCISCHNTRNGLHNDTIALTSFTAPHVAAQGDVFVGKNAYFVTGDYLSHHASIEDTCVTCHVTLVPDDNPTHGNNHTFAADRTICKNCHGTYVTGEGLATDVENNVVSIKNTAGDGMKRTLVNRVGAGQSYALRAWDPVADVYSSSSASNVVLSAAPTAVGIIEVHGQVGLTLTMPSPVTITWTNGSQTTVTEVSLQLGSLKDPTTSATIFAPSSDLMKSLWNVLLVEDDASGGAHNPSFVTDVLYQTQVKIGAWRTTIP